MNTTRPRARRSAGSSAWVRATGPSTLTSNWLRRSSIGSNSSGPPKPIPALFTSASSPPPRSSTSAAAAAICAASVTSSSIGTMRSPPAAFSASPSAALRTPASTVQPEPASRSAVARPMPVEAPVISTVGIR